MVRASEAYRICTDRPIPIDYQSLQQLEEKLVQMVESRTQEKFDPSKIDQYLTTRGLIGVTKNYIKEKDRFEKSKEDKLPDGAKNYLQLVWLNKNYGFPRQIGYKVSEMFAAKKGTLCEVPAIEFLNKNFFQALKKNYTPKIKGFLSGSCDIRTVDTIYDIKVPESYLSFRKKISLPEIYRWQLISYCYLYNKIRGKAIYILMPTPLVLIKEITKYMSPKDKEEFFKMEDLISKLPPKKRIKHFEIDPDTLQEDIEFLESRLVMSDKYYSGLTYEICMNMI